MYWSLAWLTIFPFIALLLSIKFHHPDFLDGLPWFTFGRLRPVHVNGVIFGAFSTPFLGLLYYVVPRLCGRPMAGMGLSRFALYGWNFFLLTGVVSFPFGYHLCFEAGEFEWPWNLLRWLVLARHPHRRRRPARAGEGDLCLSLDRHLRAPRLCPRWL